MSIYDGSLKSKHSSISLYIYFGIQRSVEGKCNLYMEAFFSLDFFFNVEKLSWPTPTFDPLLPLIFDSCSITVFQGKIGITYENFGFLDFSLRLKKLSKRWFLSAGTLFLLLVLVLVWSNTYIPGSSRLWVRFPTSVVVKSPVFIPHENSRKRVTTYM